MGEGTGRLLGGACRFRGELVCVHPEDPDRVHWGWTGGDAAAFRAALEAEHPGKYSAWDIVSPVHLEARHRARDLAFNEALGVPVPWHANNKVSFGGLGPRSGGTAPPRPPWTTWFWTPTSGSAASAAGGATSSATRTAAALASGAAAR